MSNLPITTANRSAAPLDATTERLTNGSSQNDLSQNNASTPKLLDARRARQILDRAFSLSERGDFAGAIVACRQSIALAPRDASSHSMLGFLLERNGDYAGAMKSYQDTLKLAPDSPLERDSLRRLQVQHGATSSSNADFQFDDNELFDDNVSDDDVFDDSVLTAPQSNLAQNNATSSTQSATATAPNANAPNASLVANRAAASTAATPVAPRSAPVVTRSAATASSVAPNAVARNVIMYNAVASNALSASPSVDARLNWWSALDAYPNFWTRSLPLMAVAGTGLLWMLWAHNAAVPRVATVATTTTIVEGSPNRTPVPADATNAVSNTSNAIGATSDAANANASPNATSANAANANANATSATNAAPTPNANGLFSSSWVITNKPQRATPTPARVGANENVNRSNTNSNRRDVANERSARRSSQTLPSRPRNNVPRNNAPPTQLPSSSALPPAPVVALPRVDSPTSSTRSLSRQPNFSSPQNTAPTIDNDVQLPPTNADDGGNGGIRPYEGAVPQFPNPTTNSQQSQAPAQSSSAQAPVAQPSSLNSRNNGAAETAYRYQSRALIYLERGDNAKARADFNNAIAFYRRQIATGVGVADARRGLEACRKGLSLVAR